MGQYNVAILSLETDLHALVIKDALSKKLGVNCDIIAVDRQACSPSINIPISCSVEFLPSVLSAEGKRIPVKSLDLIWLRRMPRDQTIPSYVRSKSARELITKNCWDAFIGMFQSTFQGSWVSKPQATERAENKVIQLHLASNLGFRTPRTLISQDPSAIKDFYHRNAGKVVVKPLRTVSGTSILTRMLPSLRSIEDLDMMACPTIYQEYIPGKRHLRVVMFGAQAYSFMVETADLDWRENFRRAKVQKVTTTEGLKKQLQKLLRVLQLEMGVFDLKLTAEGEPIWLEVNPQGQFLFLEAMTGFDLTSAFTKFLRCMMNR